MNDGMSESVRVYEDGGFGARPAGCAAGCGPAGWPHQGGQGCL